MKDLPASNIYSKTTPASLKPDPQEILKTLQSMWGEPDQIVELRVLEARTRDDKYPHTYSGYFNNPQDLARDACSVSEAKGWYITLNPCIPEVIARRCNRAGRAGKGETTTDNDILMRCWLPIDTDAQRLSGISATNEEHEAALSKAREVADYLCSIGWPEPIFGDSGNGGHLLYAIRLPAKDDGVVEHCLKALAARFNDERVKIDTTVSNPARIWKLYGTPACKGDSTPDRPHRMARLLKLPDSIEVVPVPLLDSLASEFVQAEKPVKKMRSETPKVTVSPSAQSRITQWDSFDVPAFIRRHALDVKDAEPWEGGQRWIFNECPWRSGDGETAFLVQHANGAISAGCQHETCPGSRSTGNHWADLRALFGETQEKITDLRSPVHADSHELDSVLCRLQHTEFGLAVRFVARYGSWCRYIEPWQSWLVFDGKRWVQSNVQAEQFAQETILALQREAKFIEDTNEEKK